MGRAKPEIRDVFRSAPATDRMPGTARKSSLIPTFALHIHSNKITNLSQVNFPELSQKASAEEAMRRNKAEIVAFLKSEGERFASFLEGLSEAFLGETVAMPPAANEAPKSRFELLLSPKEHEMHHRGQLMMLQRMVGVVPHLTRQRQERMAQAQGARAH